jgi:phosphohistidine phosphatase SixA
MMMPRRSLLLAALALPASARAAAWAAPLMQGGFNLYLRHAITDRSQRDTGRLFDRLGQRNLSEAGRAQARAIGAGIARSGIPLGALRTSPVYRASDTAALLGLPLPVVVDMDLVADDYSPDVPATIAALRRVFATAPAPGRNSLLVGHIVPLGMATGRGLAEHEYPEGALAVLRPGGATGFALERIIPPAALIGG